MEDDLHSKYPIGEGIALCILTPKDAEQFFLRVSEMREILTPWFPWAKSLQSVKGCARFIEGQQGFLLGIWQQQTLIGSIHVTMEESGTAELTYWLNEKFQGHGFITRGCEIIISYLFKEFGMYRIEIYCGERNRKSNGVPVRLSFIREGERRGACLVEGQRVTSVIWGLLRPEWEEQIRLRNTSKTEILSSDSLAASAH